MDLVERYLPEHFYVRLPVPEQAWRGRIVLLLWALGYPLAMAWSLGLTSDQDMVDVYRDAVARLDDDRLVAQLDADESDTWRWLGVQLLDSRYVTFEPRTEASASCARAGATFCLGS